MGSYFGTITEQHRALPIYVTTIGIFFDEISIERDNGYPDYQWIQTVSGSGRVTIEDIEYDLHPNQGMFIPKDLPHHYRRSSDSWVTHWITFNGLSLEMMMKELEFAKPRIIDLPADNDFLVQLESIFSLSSDNFNLNAFKVSTRLYHFIENVHHISHLETSKKSSHKATTLQSAINYMNQYYMLDITIDEVARIAGITPQYLCKLFKTQLNMRPFEYLKRIRINKAKSMLISSGKLTTGEIAELVGIHNPSYFTSIFKSLESMTPSEFVKLHQRSE